MREGIEPSKTDTIEGLNELVKKQIRYNNYARYHSAIGFVILYAVYSGKAEAILESRKKTEKSEKYNESD